MKRTTVASILCNPIYVKADLNIYEFFKSQGTNIVNDASGFTGTNGCYFYRARGQKDVATKYDLQGHTLVLAPSAGLVSSELWLKCRKKILSNPSYQSGRKAVHTWLAGKLKCGRCHKALKFEAGGSHNYFRCRTHVENRSCEGAGRLWAAETEAFIYAAMVKKLKPFQTLRSRGEASTSNPKLTVLQVELTKVESEIEVLIDTLTEANPVLLSYVNSKIEELDSRKQELAKEIADLSAKSVSPEQLQQLSGYLDTWDDISFDDKRHVVDLMISVIYATSEKIDIIWKF